MDLCIAATNGQIDIVKQLLTVLSIEEINKQNDCGGMTALHYACIYDQIKVIKLMLSCAKVNPNTVDGNGNTPLSESVRMLRVNAVKLLIGNPQINVNHKNNNGNTCLHIAVAAAVVAHDNKSEIEIVKMLLSRYDTIVDATNGDGVTIIHWLLEPDNLELLKILLVMRPIPMVWRDSDNNTILHLAYEKGDMSVIKEMKNHYSVALVNERSVNNRGQLPSQVAQSLGKMDLVEYAMISEVPSAFPFSLVSWLTSYFN